MTKPFTAPQNQMTNPRSALWQGQDIATAVSGQWCGLQNQKDWVVSGLSIDSRSLVEGDLFIPLSDARDGHDFIPMALEKGAAGVLSARDISDVPAVMIADPEAALRELAIAARKRSKAQRVGVTGSVGKTSVKDMIAHICAAQNGKATHKSQRSFNNHWGVPLTMASMARDTDFGIFEMGMNHVGELSDLTQIVRPHIAMITKIAAAHMEHFTGLEQIAHAKAEIFEGLVRGGTAIIPHQGEHTDILTKAAKRAEASLKTFGAAQGDMTYSNVKLGARSSHFDVHYDGQTASVVLGMAGEHAVKNASGAILCAVCLGIPLGTAAAALSDLRASDGRGAVYDLADQGHKYTLIDESYNANPKSMRASFAAFALHSGRKMVVLGDMYELGPDETALHAGLADDVLALDPEFVICCGDRMGALYHELSGRMITANRSGRVPQFFHCETQVQGVEIVSAHLSAVDLVMIKGSNASGMGRIASKLINTNTTSKMDVTSTPSSTHQKDEMNVL